MALATVGDIIAECRVLLQDNDSAAYRYTQQEMVTGLNIALLEARRLRADLFLSMGMEVPSYTLSDLAVTVPIEPMYRPAFVYYVTGRMQIRDDEETTDARASALMNKFVGQMLSPQS
jgi:hypothetical protein